MSSCAEAMTPRSSSSDFCGAWFSRGGTKGTWTLRTSSRSASWVSDSNAERSSAAPVFDLAELLNVADKAGLGLWLELCPENEDGIGEATALAGTSRALPLALAEISERKKFSLSGAWSVFVRLGENRGISSSGGPVERRLTGMLEVDAL